MLWSSKRGHIRGRVEAHHRSNLSYFPVMAYRRRHVINHLQNQGGDAYESFCGCWQQKTYPTKRLMRIITISLVPQHPMNSLRRPRSAIRLYARVGDANIGQLHTRLHMCAPHKDVHQQYIIIDVLLQLQPSCCPYCGVNPKPNSSDSTAWVMLCWLDRL